jgi:hypothetical protein
MKDLSELSLDIETLQSGLPFWRLTIGTVRLENERQVKGFLCEGIAAHGATDTPDLAAGRTILKASVLLAEAIFSRL